MGVSATGASMSTEDLEIRILIEELRKTDPEAAECYESGRSDCLQMNWGIVPITPAGIGNPSAAMGLVRAYAFVRNLFGATRTTGAVARTEATAAALFSPNGLASEVGLIRSLSHAVASTDAGRNVGRFTLWAAAGLTTLVSGEPSYNVNGPETNELAGPGDVDREFFEILKRGGKKAERLKALYQEELAKRRPPRIPEELGREPPESGPWDWDIGGGIWRRDGEQGNRVPGHRTPIKIKQTSNPTVEANSDGIEGLEITEKSDGTLEIHYGDQVEELPVSDHGFVIIHGDEGPDDTITIYRDKGGSYGISRINNPRAPIRRPAYAGDASVAPVASINMMNQFWGPTGKPHVSKDEPEKTPGPQPPAEGPAKGPGTGKGKVPKEEGPRGDDIVGKDMN